MAAFFVQDGRGKVGWLPIVFARIAYFYLLRASHGMSLEFQGTHLRLDRLKVVQQVTSGAIQLNLKKSICSHLLVQYRLLARNSLLVICILLSSLRSARPTSNIFTLPPHARVQFPKALPLPSCTQTSLSTDHPPAASLHPLSSFTIRLGRLALHAHITLLHPRNLSLSLDRLLFALYRVSLS